MAEFSGTGRAERDLASVQLGGQQLVKVREIAGAMDVPMSTVTRWAIEQFDLSLFLSQRQLELTGNRTEQTIDVPA